MSRQSSSTSRQIPGRVTITPGGLSGTVRVPGDKSIGHRALIIGALADGPCTVSGVPDSEDVLATAAAVDAMGAHVTLEPGEHGLQGSVAGPLTAPNDTIDCGNSGTALRLLAGIAAGIDGATTLTGDASLRARPMGRISRPLRALGATVDGPDDATRAPLTVRGVIRDRGEHHSEVASAQVKSALLLAAVRAGVGITVVSPLPSRDHTERILSSMGLDIATETANGERVSLQGGTSPHATDIVVPGDPSSAAFWWVAAAMAGTVVTTTKVCMNPGRTGALHVLSQLGAAYTLTDVSPGGSEPIATVTVDGTGGLTGEAGLTSADVVSAIDELPILAVLAASSQGGLIVADAAELRVKESDRISALERLFAALGMAIETRHDGFTVSGGQQPRTGSFDAGLDHRLAMSAAIAATVASGPVTIEGFASTGSSYPGFADDFVSLGGRLESTS